MGLTHWRKQKLSIDSPHFQGKILCVYTRMHFLKSSSLITFWTELIVIFGLCIIHNTFKNIDKLLWIYKTGLSFFFCYSLILSAETHISWSNNGTRLYTPQLWTGMYWQLWMCSLSFPWTPESNAKSFKNLAYRLWRTAEYSTTFAAHLSSCFTLT